jgi:nucleotide-binding universal stress UspA family protein
MKVLLAVDGSEYTKRMLSYLATHHELLGENNVFTLLTVTPVIPGRISRFVDQATVKDWCAEVADQVLKPAQAFAAEQRWDSSTAHVQGRPAEAIVAYAEETRPDLIVMGSHGHSALGTMIMGSTVSGVLARCSVPVLLVR